MNNPYKAIDIAADQLVKIYQRGYIEVLKRYNELAIAGNDTKHTRALLQEIMNILNELDAHSVSWIESIIPEAYAKGFQAAYILYPKLNKGEIIAKSFSGIHKQAIEVIAYNMQSSLLDATQKVGRQANDLYRKVGLDATRKRLMLGESRKWTQEEIKRALEDNGLTAFVDKAGRSWRLDTYAEVVARTTPRETITQGTINRILESGRDLVQISSHSTTCSVCAPLQGKVFSLTGKTEGYPKYEDYIPVHPRCYDELTEVYTASGWKLIKDVRVGEKCLSLNPETLDLEYVDVILTHKYTDNKMVHFTHKHFDMMVTLEHDCLWQSDGERKKVNGKWKFVKAKELLYKKSGRFYRSSKWKGEKISNVKLGEKELTPVQYAKFMAWYLSDGSCDNTYKRINIAQSKDKSNDTYNEIKQLLEEIGYNYLMNEERFVITGDLYNDLKQYGKSEFKFIPNEIKNSTPDIIRIFLDTYVKADGHRRKAKKYKDGNFRDEKVYFTSSKRLADDIGELILKVGNRPSFYLEKNKGKIKKFKNGIYEIKTNLWYIRECYSSTTGLRELKKEIVDYDGYVYCLTLKKYHTLYIRRNGKCVWSGNCRHTLMGYIREFDSRADEVKEFSNTSLTKDNRTPQQKAAYETEQYNKTRFRLDKEQYERYVQRLGEDAPKSFSGFRSMKKANNKNWANLQKKFTDDVSKETNDDIINNIKSGKYNLTLNKQAYEKHIEGHKRYEDYVSRLKSKGSPHLPSSLTISYEEAQELIKKFSSTGQIIINRGQVKEIIKDNNKVIGIFRDIPNGIEEETTNFIIHYSKSSKKGAHIVPLEEDKDV